MAKKRWVGLRSAEFRKTLLVICLILLFCCGIWLGSRKKPSDSQQVKSLEQQVHILEQQVHELNQAMENKN